MDHTPAPVPWPALPATPAGGLTAGEAARRLARFGANAMPDSAPHPWRRALVSFWAPVPWMLEAAAALELGLGKYPEAAVIVGLLLFNAVIGLAQEGRAQHTLQAPKSRLALTAAVRRDAAWTTRPAAELVPGDLIKLSLGGIVPADARLTAGQILLDQSMLTGESLPVEAGAGATSFAGALVRRGEAEALVTATGIHTEFGRTAELVRTAQLVSSQQKAVVRVVRNLVGFACVVTLGLAAYAALLHLPLSAIVPLLLTALLGAIPVALPATFTLAAAIGAKALARRGVLPTRLSAVDEAGTMDVLCVDKTGTLTQNHMRIASVQPRPGFDAAHVLMLAALASSEGGQDPVDGAIRAIPTGGLPGAPHLLKFLPFDPAMKMSEAIIADPAGAVLHVLKGAFAAVSGLVAVKPDALAASSALQAQGYRVLAVAAGPATAMRLAGLIALSDPPRDDSAALIIALRDLGVRTVMVTGDAPRTAEIVARAVGLAGAICPPGPIPKDVRPDAFAVFAGVLPADKYTLER